MILPKNILSIGFSLAILALILTAILWYLPEFGSDFAGLFLDNWVSMIAFFIAAYWASGIERRLR